MPKATTSRQDAPTQALGRFSATPRVRPPRTAPRMLPMPPSTAAVKALRAGREAHGVDDAGADAEEEAGRPPEQTAQDKGLRDDAVDVDAHQAGRLGVLGHGPDPSAQLGQCHDPVEEDEHRDRRHRDQDVIALHLSAEDREQGPGEA